MGTAATVGITLAVVTVAAVGGYLVFAKPRQARVEASASVTTRDPAAALEGPDTGRNDAVGVVQGILGVLQAGGQAYAAGANLERQRLASSNTSSSTASSDEYAFKTVGG